MGINVREYLRPNETYPARSVCSVLLSFELAVVLSWQWC